MTSTKLILWCVLTVGLAWGLFDAVARGRILGHNRAYSLAAEPIGFAGSFLFQLSLMIFSFVEVLHGLGLAGDPAGMLLAPMKSVFSG